jgi:hypothetical protein
MNDESALGTVRESLATAKDSLTGIQMSTPLDAIVRHGQAVRRRHWLMAWPAPQRWRRSRRWPLA